MSLRHFQQYVTEGPPAFKKNNLTVMSLFTFLRGQQIKENWTPLGAHTRLLPPEELQAYAGRIVGQTKGKLEKYSMPYIHRSNLVPIKDESGKDYDLDKLRLLITKRPPALLSHNAKMEHSGGIDKFFDIGLPALKGLAVNEKTGEFVIVDTCPGAGTCKTFCYAMKGGYIQFPASSLGSTRTLNFLLNDPDGFTHQLSTEIAVQVKGAIKKNKKVIIRWHDAGDFFSPEYMDAAFKVAHQYPMVDFYAYTKIAAVAQASNKPENFKFNFSGGAQPSQEKMINFAVTKHSRVVPKSLFDDLIMRQGRKQTKDALGRMQFKSPADLDIFRHRLAHQYAISDIATIITYDEMMRMPPGPAPHWNVLVWSGHGDDSANRHDVIGTFLLLHTLAAMCLLGGLLWRVLSMLPQIL